MVVFQVPAGMPEHNLLAVKIGNYLTPHLTREYVVLYDTFCYISHEMLERLGHFKAYLYERLGVKEYFLFETGRRSGKLFRVYRLKSEIKPFSQYEVIPLEGKVPNSQVLGVDVPVEWTL
jgi:hypothetical protein